jgi:hypothetical protein
LSPYVAELLTFRRLATLSSIICFELAATWLFTPWLVPLLWQVEYSYPAALFGRQSGALFLAIGVMFLLARTCERSTGRDALVSGFVVGCLALAALGLYELSTGHAGFGILSAVLVEVFLAAGFLVSLRSEQLPSSDQSRPVPPQ